MKQNIQFMGFSGITRVDFFVLFHSTAKEYSVCSLLIINSLGYVKLHEMTTHEYRTLAENWLGMHEFLNLSALLSGVNKEALDETI